MYPPDHIMPNKMMDDVLLLVNQLTLERQSRHRSRRFIQGGLDA
jgi:hypothetical protein